MSKAQSRELYYFQKYPPKTFMFREESEKHLGCRPFKQQWILQGVSNPAA